MTELKSCPFCGGEPSNIVLGMSIFDGHQIACENECAAGPFVDGRDEAEASKLWNTRASSSHEALRTATIEECAKVADDFSWTIPIYTKEADVNLATDYTACAVSEQIASAIRALSDTERQP